MGCKNDQIELMWLKCYRITIYIFNLTGLRIGVLVMNKLLINKFTKLIK